MNHQHNQTRNPHDHATQPKIQNDDPILIGLSAFFLGIALGSKSLVKLSTHTKKLTIDIAQMLGAAFSSQLKHQASDAFLKTQHKISN